MGNAVPLTFKTINVVRPAADAAVVLPTTQTTAAALTAGITSTSAINDTFEITSSAISVAAGDTLFCRIDRAGNTDSNDAEIGIIRIGAVIQ